MPYLWVRPATTTDLPEMTENAPASSIIETLTERCGGGRITIGEMTDMAGSRAFGLVLLLFALPEALPLPIAGISAVIAVPLILLSAQAALFGAEPRLPEWLRRRSIDAGLFRAVAGKAVPILRRMERVSRPRWQGMARAGRALGLACLLLAVIIALPIPFGNLLPALCIAGIAFGLLQRDGVIIAASLAVGAVVVTGMTVAVLVAGDAILSLVGAVPGAS